ncbi:hypothetical protein B0T18DRAFT_333667 [Schizothecium vesticola]|uniref:DUF1479-domain-containing protein n=1 Tax=Schizothecium vesticola TaxID=314040 RepID=A0AA40EHC2_9PEZI|nr:hypothetical protein B0T18DRAFT_333667 [Schizothecium vesticola]
MFPYARFSRFVLLRPCQALQQWQTCGIASNSKREGDISDSFTSLSLPGKSTPLPDRFRQRKLDLVGGREDAIIASWERLLPVLRRENDIVAERGSSIVPEIRFRNLHDDLEAKKTEIRQRGAAIIRGVIPQDEARAYKFQIEEYVRQNPQTRGFPPENPQVIELYWSLSQLRARTHPSMLKAQRTLMTSLWHSSNPDTPISLQTPLSYADRLRIRQPGDAQFSLGPHADGGSVERWEAEGYGRGGVYDAVFRGEWEAYDPWEAAGRVDAVTDLYGGLGSCSMFRMFQGWLSMSTTGPGEGTLLVNPLVKESTVYSLLRPFFRPVRSAAELGDAERFLDVDNWEFTAGDKMTSELQGATPGHGQEFPEGLHPHLELDKTMVHLPKVDPGDYVVWHCDAIHAVDRRHGGTSDASVLYIPVCPTTEASARYVARQRDAFLAGTPPSDFPGGTGEAGHLERPTVEHLAQSAPEGVQSLGLAKVSTYRGDSVGGKEAVRRANHVLGF